MAAIIRPQTYVNSLHVKDLERKQSIKKANNQPGKHKHTH